MSPEVLVVGGVRGWWFSEVRLSLGGEKKHECTVRILEGLLLKKILNFLDLQSNLDMDKLLAAN